MDSITTNNAWNKKVYSDPRLNELLELYP